MRIWTQMLHGSFALFVLAEAMLGCGREAIATSDALPVRRVVIYRNGVAYFERSGHVARDEVHFQMKPEEVGDFLATLAVIERGGSSVRAAAFPIRSGDEEAAATSCDDDVPATTPTPKSQQRAQDKKKPLQTVVLSLDGREHDLEVGYVAASPIWRPSYRLVVHPGGEADLQAWGIVENLSGEDWPNVKLSLVAGAPLAFQAQLGVPVIPTRPVVTDEGEVIAAVPHAETTLLQENKASASTSSAAPEQADSAEFAAGEPEAETHQAKPKGGRVRLAQRAASTAPPPAAVAAAPAMSLEPSPPRSLGSLAAVATEGSSTRYDLPLPVTIPDQSATMVMLTARRVAGEALFLFAPDGAVPESTSHPFRVARFTNGAGAIERGPIAIFEQGAFLGQGLVDPLPAGATATVPFALERSIAIDLDRKSDLIGERIAKIENAMLTVERDLAQQTKYRMRNGGDVAVKILVKHPRIVGARLYAPPPGTEDNVGTASALVPASVMAHATTELVVDERTREREPADWFGAIADNAVKAFIADSRSDRDVAHKLSAAWTLRADIVGKRAEREGYESQTSKLAQATEETRRNLRAIEKNRTADALRQKLTARLAEASSRLDELNRKTVELDAQLAELRVRWSEAIRDIELVSTSPAAGL